MTKRSSSTKSSGTIGIKEFLFSLLLILAAWFGKEYLGIELSDLGSSYNGGTQYVGDPSAGGVQVAFTAPVYPDKAENRVGGLDVQLAAAVNGAQQSVDIAAFDFDLERVADALTAVHNRGVRVRMVVDTDNLDLEEMELLQKAGIPVVDDDRDAFMHNKFVIIDGYQVWMGSWNLTDNGTYRNNNNVLVIDSQRLAENYTAEFKEMFEDSAFGVTSPDDTPHPFVEINGIQFENYFEAEGDVRVRIIELIEGAQSEIEFMAFAFTDDDIAKALIDRAREGIPVRGVIEGRNAESTGADFGSLSKGGVDVLKDGNPYILHHKVIIVDDIVITGSYNFTASAANNNDENVLIVHSSDIAAQYRQEFERVYKQAKEAQ
ncbi:MAG: phospholipase [Anaerolineae bacterium]|nr:phospholipase [Anaerolineae bacterium]